LSEEISEAFGKIMLHVCGASWACSIRRRCLATWTCLARGCIRWKVSFKASLRWMSQATGGLSFASRTDTSRMSIISTIT